jgi:DNA invertase Pin-like site-specific DNA recombinase
MIAIKDAVNNGYRVTDVAKYFNKSNSNISGHLRKIGVKRQRCYAPNSKINKETSDKIRKEIESGVSVSEIIIKYKISSSSVYNIKNNITWNNN